MLYVLIAYLRMTSQLYMRNMVAVEIGLAMIGF